MPRIINIKNDGAAGQSGQLRVGQLIQAVEGTHTRGQYPEIMQLLFVDICSPGLKHKAIADLLCQTYLSGESAKMSLTVQELLPSPTNICRSVMFQQ